MVDGKWIYNRLRFCNHMRITSKVYGDWIRTNSTLVGFIGHTNTGLGKQEKLEKVRKYIADHELPLEVVDNENHLTEFRINIIK